MPSDPCTPAREDLDEIAERYARDVRLCEDAREARRLRDEMIAAALPFAGRLSRRYRARREPDADLDQVARLGLIKAVDRYDPARGSFTAYAVTTIVGELKRHFRDHTWGVHVPRRLQDLVLEIVQARATLAGRLGRLPTDRELAEHCAVDAGTLADAQVCGAGYRPVSLSRPVGDGTGELADLIGDADPAVELVSDRLTMTALVARLPARERRILSMRFYGDRTQSEIAAELGMSQMHVSRLLTRILTWMREAMLSDAVPRWPGEEPQPDGFGLAFAVREDGGVDVRISGELDRDNADRLRESLLAVVGRQPAGRRITLDLTGVPLLDAAGIAVLLAVHEAARVRGVAVSVTGLQPYVRRVAAASGLGTLPAADVS